MPSASGKLEKQASSDTFDPMKQVLTIVEKKVRNLEKRKAKLDSYRHDSQNGKDLNDDQKKAVEKYDQVVEVLEFAKELQKQFQNVIAEGTKAQKKAVRREQLERQQFELQRIKEIMVYQELLNSMGSDDVRQDFLNGTNGAVKLSEEELNSLDELYKAISPEREDIEDNSDFDQLLTLAADHMQALLDCKNKEVFGTTYKALNETLQKINCCSYFNKNNEVSQENEELNIEGKNTEEIFSNESHYRHNSEQNISSPRNDPLIVPQSGLLGSQVDRSYYQMENTSLYTDQNHPIQEVLSVQGSLNFLQESQLEVESSRLEQSVPAHSAAPYASVQYSTSQPLASSCMASQHRSQRTNDVTTAISSHPSASNIILANSSVQQQQLAQGMSTPMGLPISQPADFDPSRPIPTQTYTNQSFSSNIHSMMAAAVSQNFVPVTLSHPMAPSHVMPNNMVVQSLPRSTVTPPSLAANPNTLSMVASHSQGSGHVTTSSLSQQMPLNVDNHPVSVGSSQYECDDIHAYQSANNSQAYMNRDSFADGPGYSGNLKRGLNVRGGARSGNAPRMANNPRGRMGYRN